MNLIKDNDIDKTALLEYLDSKTSDPDMKELMRVVAEKCTNDAHSKKDEILQVFERPPFSIKRGECNAVHHYMTVCLNMQIFRVSNIF